MRCFGCMGELRYDDTTGGTHPCRKCALKPVDPRFRVGGGSVEVGSRGELEVRSFVAQEMLTTKPTMQAVLAAWPSEVDRQALKAATLGQRYSMTPEKMFRGKMQLEWRGEPPPLEPADIMVRDTVANMANYKLLRVFDDGSALVEPVGIPPMPRQVILAGSWELV